MASESAPVPARSQTQAEPMPAWPTGEDNGDDDEEFRAGGELRTSDGRQPGPMDFSEHQRDYDDEDAALQAALKASMEDIPSDWVAPTLQNAKPMKPTAEPVAKTAEIPTKKESKAVSSANATLEASGTAESGQTKKPGRDVPVRKESQSKFTEEIQEAEDTPEEALSAGQLEMSRMFPDRAQLTESQMRFARGVWRGSAAKLSTWSIASAERRQFHLYHIAHHATSSWRRSAGSRRNDHIITGMHE